MSLFKTVRQFLLLPSARYSAGALLLVGVIAGMTIWGGTTEVVSQTSSTEFCISCHEINDNAWAEFKETVHYRNSTGTQAECADCHIPHDLMGKTARKVAAVREVYGHMTGLIDTPEKYEAHRLTMAEKVWDEMRADDSASCRSCHKNMEDNLDLQYEWARNNHLRMAKENLTCIDCHQGIAHKLPSKVMNKSIPPIKE